MRRRPDSDPTRFATVVLLCIVLISCTLVYAFYTLALGPGGTTNREGDGGWDGGGRGGSEGRGCCKGIEGLELWGDAVKWGTDFKFSRPEECCEACRKMCEGNDGPCLCDSWVFCGDGRTCGDKLGECWLKKQKDPLAPDRHDGGPTVSWTSGLIFGRGQGIIGLETEYGTMHIKLFPECAPRSVAYILELLTLRHCAGCQFFRAESRGRFWDVEGNHLKNESFGPPYALLQGTLEVNGGAFEKIPSEFCLDIRRGSVVWIGSGPEFFISLANHEEWRNQYTVFGSVLHKDIAIVEKIAGLPTTLDVWNNVYGSRELEKYPPVVVDVRVPMSKNMVGIQKAIIEVMNACLKEMRKTDKVDVEDLTVENGLIQSFDEIVRMQLDPLWHSSKQLVSDLKASRKLLDYLVRSFLKR